MTESLGLKIKCFKLMTTKNNGLLGASKYRYEV